MASSLCICSVMKIQRFCTEWPSEMKWAATRFSRRRCLTSDHWPFSRMWRAFSCSPTYCLLYIGSHRPHWLFTVCRGFDWVCFPSGKALEPFYRFDGLHILRRVCWHQEFPLWDKCCFCLNVARTNKVLRLGWHQYATLGGFLLANCRSFWDAEDGWMFL